MSDPISTRSMPGLDAMSNSVAATTKSLQSFASEMQRMSAESMDRTSQTMEKLRGAKSIEEVVSIQTTYLQQFFSTYVENTRRFGELIAALPVELAKQGHGAVRQGTEAADEAVHQMGEQFGQHHG